MTATEPTARLPHARAAHAPSAGRPGTAWAWAGVVGGIVGLVGLMATGNLYDAATGAVTDNERLTAAVTGNAHLVWIQQVVCVAVVACLAVFAAGFHRHLASREPAGSLVPAVAAGGVLLTAAAVLVGGGLATEMYFALVGPNRFDADTVGAQVTFYNTIAWLWGPLGLAAGATAVVGFRRRAVGRPTAVFSALMTVLLAATQAFPAQYAAVVPGALWLVGTGTALAVGARRARR